MNMNKLTQTSFLIKGYELLASVNNWPGSKNTGEWPGARNINFLEKIKFPIYLDYVIHLF